MMKPSYGIRFIADKGECNEKNVDQKHINVNCRLYRLEYFAVLRSSSRGATRNEHNDMDDDSDHPGIDLRSDSRIRCDIRLRKEQCKKTGSSILRIIHRTHPYRFGTVSCIRFPYLHGSYNGKNFQHHPNFGVHTFRKSTCGVYIHASVRIQKIISFAYII
jgi:hypothetical protein